ncbi:hypothetical protein ACIA8R_43910 [Nonomuraea sp. NPDC051191]|uniref:hypothetical protein n=1 Tax=Nonomuraea sp. NPDC051191 TaxID=3364372 RepID=UPI00378CA130
MPGPRTPVDHMGALTARENVNAMGALSKVEGIHADVSSTYQYKNVNTGQVVQYPHRSARLDALEVWILIGVPDEPAAGPVQGQAGPGLADVATAITRPAEHEPKKEWVAYAIQRGMKPRDAQALSKQALIEEFGQEGDIVNGED